MLFDGAGLQTTRRSFLACAAAGAAPFASGRAPCRGPISTELDRLLDEIERRACRYFYEEADAATGQVRDRAATAGRETRRVSSIAATGFGLSALAIGDRRRYLPRGEAAARALRTLEFLARHPGHRRGFFYHFVDMSTGERVWDCELSSVDTAWLLCGALHARMHFDTPAIRRAAGDLLSRVDWRWMLDGGTTLSHGWTPEAGFLPYRWDCYSELQAMYLLAAASGATSIPPASWHAWKRPLRIYRDRSYIDSAAPLFTHQYSHAWFDFRGRRDSYADYFENSRTATAVHRLMCLELAPRFPWYGPEMWGVTASDSMLGYQAWGGFGYPPDGTLVPCAAGGSLPFLPRECGAVLLAMMDRYGAKAWGRYGFTDAFLPGQDWYSPDVIGIDLGIMALMAENARTGMVWKQFMAAPEARRAMDAAGFARVRRVG